MDYKEELQLKLKLIEAKAETEIKEIESYDHGAPNIDAIIANIVYELFTDDVRWVVVFNDKVDPMFEKDKNDLIKEHEECTED